MRLTPSTSVKACLVASALSLLPLSALADETLGAASAADPVPTEARASASALDDAPSDEGEPPGESERAPNGAQSHGGRSRRWTDGPRRVPVPRGASFARATRLGLGTLDAAHELLREAPRANWKRAAGSTPPRELRWPVEVGALGRGFGYVRHDHPEVRHNGVDIATPRGMVIRAAADGIVAYSDNGLRGYGNCVIVVHANGWVTLYAHADRITVQPGYHVRRGERIGFVGSTGRSDGPHLHFELRVDGEPIDPLDSFRGEPWVEGRTRLAALRRRHGGHTYGHLGEITPDYDADTPAPRAAVVHAAPAEPSRPAAAAPESAELPAAIARLLARGPSSAERAALRDHPAGELQAPIRLDVEATYADAVLRYAAATSTNVRASATGRVAYVGAGVREGMTSVVLVHANGWVTVYSGVIDATVSVGALVEAGDRVAIVRDTRIGLAFELRSRGRSLDPRAFFSSSPALVATRE